MRARHTSCARLCGFPKGVWAGRPGRCSLLAGRPRAALDARLPAHSIIIKRTSSPGEGDAVHTLRGTEEKLLAGAAWRRLSRKCSAGVAWLGARRTGGNECQLNQQAMGKRG